MNTYLSHPLHSVIGQLQTSSHQLEIEIGRYAHTYLWKKEISNNVIKEWNLMSTIFVTIQFFMK